MSNSPGTGGSNPRKFSEKIALHNQKQAEETRAFEQLMTDLTVSRVKQNAHLCVGITPQPHLGWALFSTRLRPLCWPFSVMSLLCPFCCFGIAVNENSICCLIVKQQWNRKLDSGFSVHGWILIVEMRSDWPCVKFTVPSQVQMHTLSSSLASCLVDIWNQLLTLSFSVQPESVTISPCIQCWWWSPTFPFSATVEHTQMYYKIQFTWFDEVSSDCSSYSDVLSVSPLVFAKAIKHIQKHLMPSEKASSDGRQEKLCSGKTFGADRRLWTMPICLYL